MTDEQGVKKDQEASGDFKLQPGARERLIAALELMRDWVQNAVEVAESGKVEIDEAGFLAALIHTVVEQQHFAQAIAKAEGYPLLMILRQLTACMDHAGESLMVAERTQGDAEIPPGSVVH